MPFDAKGFYDLALWLVQQRTDEASLRTAISRVYYAAHLLAVQRLIQKGWEAKGTGDDYGRVHCYPWHSLLSTLLAQVVHCGKKR